LAIVLITSPVAGSYTFNVAPEAAERHSPPTNSPSGTDSSNVVSAVFNMMTSLAQPRPTLSLSLTLQRWRLKCPWPLSYLADQLVDLGSGIPEFVTYQIHYLIATAPGESSSRAAMSVIVDDETVAKPQHLDPAAPFTNRPKASGRSAGELKI
jgi:hypothetical protein